MSVVPNIFLIGEISSGKSSFLNAIASGFVSSVSLQRETFSPLYYEFCETANESNLDTLTNSLADMHTKNQQLREQFENNPKLELKEEIIKRTLPIRYNLPDMCIIDFPGLNDSQDTYNKFYEIFNRNICYAQMVIFLTDAEKAFNSKSEVDTYNKIKKCIDDEFTKNQHHVELVIAVNKYDETSDDDLSQIYERLPKMLTCEKYKIFRISSHKMFIHSLMNRKGNIIIPPFLKNELKKILKNSNVSITKLEKCKNGNNTIYKVLHNNLIINNALDSSDSDDEYNKKYQHTTTECYNEGDWDDIIGFIKNFWFSYIEDFENKLKNFTTHVCNKIMTTIYSVLPFDTQSIGSNIKHLISHPKISVYVNELTKQLLLIKNIITQSNTINIQKREIYMIIIKFVENLLKHCTKETNNEYFYYSFLPVSILFNTIKHKGFRVIIIDSITKDDVLNKIPDYVFISILERLLTKDQYCMEKFWENPNARKRIYAILSNEISYSENVIFSQNNKFFQFMKDKTTNISQIESIYYNHTYIYTNQIYSISDFINYKNIFCYNWLITLILMANYTPNELRYMVTLSCTENCVLAQLLADNKLNDKYLNMYQDNFALKLKLYLRRSHINTEILKNELFGIGVDDDVCKMYERYNCAEILLNKCF